MFRSPITWKKVPDRHSLRSGQDWFFCKRFKMLTNFRPLYAKYPLEIPWTSVLGWANCEKAHSTHSVYTHSERLQKVSVLYVRGGLIEIEFCHSNATYRYHTTWSKKYKLCCAVLLMFPKTKFICVRWALKQTFLFTVPIACIIAKLFTQKIKIFLRLFFLTANLIFG